MSDYALPVGFALFCWWFGTGLVFLIERALRGRPLGAAVAAIAGMAGLSVFGIAQSSLAAQAGSVYLGFASSIVLWGALELSFLRGLVTGLAVPECTRACSGWRHFGHAVLALLYHELALAFCALGVATICWNQPNPCAAWTFGLLWVMREGAKLNLFLGVPNTGEVMLPPHLKYLASFFRAGTVNALYPVSVLVTALVFLALVVAAHNTPLWGGAASELTLLATLAGLALLEHCMLILPMPADTAWSAWRPTRTLRTGTGANL